MYKQKHIFTCSAFNTEWSKKLEEKKLQEIEAEKATKIKASDDLSNWSKQREIRLSAKKDSNRQEQEVVIETLNSELDTNNVWDRVTKLVDINQESVSADKADTARMKKIFIQLKNDPLEVSRA